MNEERAESQANQLAQLIDVGVPTLGSVGASLLPSTLHEITLLNVAGPAFTASCEPGDGTAVLAAIELAPAGSVLVVDASSDPDFGYWGEILTVAAHVRNLKGLVINGCVNDVDRTRDLEFPVFATGIAARGASVLGGGSVGEPVTIGSVTVRPGDTVVADTDGVAVIAAADVETILPRAIETMEGDADLIERIRSGEPISDIRGVTFDGVRGADALREGKRCS